MHFVLQYFLIPGFLLFSHLIWAKPVQTRKVIVSGPSVHLVETVKKIHKQGGNIFDAAVAGAFTLSVTHPYFVSLGCGGFALLKSQSKISALDFRETAPAKVDSEFYIQNKASPTKTGTAVGVPGFVAGQWAIHKKYGSLPWAEVIKPALKLARYGFMVSGEFLKKTTGKFKDFNLSGKRIFFHSDGTPYLPQEYLQQKQLTQALQLIRRKDKTLVYDGLIAKDIVKTVQKNKGVMSLEDLKNYKVVWRKPISFSFNGYKVYSMPLPSSGGLILSRISQLMQNINMRKNTLYSITELHLMGEVLSFAFRPRFQMGDIPQSKPYLTEWLSSKKLKSLSSLISRKKTTKLPVLKDTLLKSKESTETTHFSIMNDQDEVVSMTLTLNGAFGSFIATDKYGIILNNQMDDFNTYPGKPNQFGLIQGQNNKVQTGGRRPLSSMSPTIIEKNGKTVMALGGSGGPMIISAVMQTFYRHLINKLDLDTAVQSPRVHNQFLPRILYVEKNRFSPIALHLLKKRGHKIEKRDSIARVYAVSKNKDNILEGAFDARGEGATGGL